MELIRASSNQKALAFYGEKGSGKSLSMVYIAYLKHKAGWDIFSNIKMKFPHIFIKDSRFYDNIPMDDTPKLILLDDVMASLYKQSLHEQEWNRFLSLTRKLISEKCILLFSTPLLFQYSDTIKEFTDMYIKPDLWLDGETKKPSKLVLSLYRNNPKKDRYQLPLKMVADLKDFDVGGLYNSWEVPKRLSSGEYRPVWEKFKVFAHDKSRGILGRLTEMIQQDFGYSANLSGKYASLVIDGFNPEKPNELSTSIQETL